MRILAAAAERLPLHTPFRISRGVKDAANVVVVTISGGGHTGRGEGVPYPRYGETTAAALAAIEGIRPAIEAGAGREALLGALPPGAARNAVDCALWDWEARTAGTTVAALAGRTMPTAPIVSALTIGLDAPGAMAAAAAALRHAPLLKVKVDATDPLAQVAAVRRAAPDARLIVDPNESWTMAEVAALQQPLADLAVSLLEQPLPAGEDEGLAGLSPLVPICADESVHTAADLPALIGRYQYVNVKLDKAGGLTEALALADAAQSAGFGLMVGCMICSSLSIAPALLVAGEAAFADLDGPLWLANDRPGGVRDTRGWLAPAEAEFWGG